jgi:selenium metabolism protein YedF
MAEKAGATVRAEKKEDGTYLYISNAGSALPHLASQPAIASAGGPLVVTIPADTMGRGDAELGTVLIRGFFHTLGEVAPRPNTIIFFNSGVKLVVEGSPVLEDLQALCDQNVEILVCGTCLGYYELKDRIRVGEVSNMYTIAETLLGADKIINL